MAVFVPDLVQGAAVHNFEQFARVFEFVAIQ